MLSFTALDYKDFIGSLYHKKPILSDEFTHFECALCTYKEDLDQNAHQNEDALVANALAPFLQNLSFETHVKEKQQGKSEIDLAVMKEGKVGIIIEAKKGDTKEFFSTQNVSCKALVECILYYLRQRNTDNGGGYLNIL